LKKCVEHSLKNWTLPESHTLLFQAGYEPAHSARPVTSLGHQVGRRVCWEGPKFFKLCSIFFNYVQHTFPGGEFLGGFAPLRPPWLRVCIAHPENHLKMFIQSKSGLILNFEVIYSLVSSEISDFTPCVHAQSEILHIKYADKTDD